MAATVTCQLDVNEYMAAGANQLDFLAMVQAASVTAAAQNATQALVFELDLSISMNDYADKSNPDGGRRIDVARSALAQSIRSLPESAYFAVVVFSTGATTLVSMRQATDANREQAAQRVEKLQAKGRTNIGAALAEAQRQARMAPANSLVTVYLLTDGNNNPEYDASLAHEMAQPTSFEFEARGFGTEYDVTRLQAIASAFSGHERFIGSPAELQQDIEETVQSAISKGLRNVRLHLWCPNVVRLRSCRREYPNKVDLMPEFTVDPNSPTDRYVALGAFGPEAKDIYFSFEVPPKDITPGDPQPKRLVARISVEWEEGGQPMKTPETEVWARWTNNTAASMRVPQGLLHYQNADELTRTIQSALGELDSNPAEATAKLTRARKKADDLGDQEKVAQIDNLIETDGDGTVKVRRGVGVDSARQALASASIRTVRRQASS